MLKIEIMRFQAQDIITTSVANCACVTANGPICDPVKGKGHVIGYDANNGDIYCNAANHTCGRGNE